jgi:hypothetical protein
MLAPPAGLRLYMLRRRGEPRTQGPGGRASGGHSRSQIRDFRDARAGRRRMVTCRAMRLQARRPRPARKTMRQCLRPLQAAWGGGKRMQTGREGADFEADKMSLWAACLKCLSSRRTTYPGIPAGAVPRCLPLTGPRSRRTEAWKDNPSGEWVAHPACRGRIGPLPACRSAP